MKKCILLLTLFVPLLTLGQTGITGKWRWTANGGGQQITLDLKSNGIQLSGTMTMAQATLKAPIVDGKEAFYLDPDTPTDNLRALFFPPVTFPIADGRIEGDAVSFTQISYMQGSPSSFRTAGPAGTQVVEKMYYKGQLQGDRITLTRTYSATPGNPWIVGAHAVTFTVERVK